MSNYIVLVKQVPDITQITDNAFDLETGTLIRSRLASTINELDTHALAFANYMKKISSDHGAKIVVLTMGPPMADEVLRYGLGRCADMAIMLTDKSLGGADTFATANPLAFAIKKIVADIFKGDSNYFVVTGMQSVDGDTAQVPPQIAEELSLPPVAYATGAEFQNGRFLFTRIISGGSQVVCPKKTGAVITVAKFEHPLFATFAATRRANKLQLIQWTGEDIKAPYIGVKGSKTRVIRVFPPGKSSRKCIHVSDVKSLAGFITDSLKTDKTSADVTKSAVPQYFLPSQRTSLLDRSFEGTEKEIEDYKFLYKKLKELGIESADKIDEYIKKQILESSEGYFHKNALDDMVSGLHLDKPTLNGEVWVVAEHQDSVVHPATFELIGKARGLADSLNTKVGVCIAGSGIKEMSKDLIIAGADNIYVIEHKLLSEFDPLSYRRAVSDCIGKYKPQIVLFAATPQGRLLAPLVSYRLRCGLTADCTSLDIRDSSRKGQIGLLFQTRPALGGNVMATICTKDSESQMATARPGVMKRLAANHTRKGSVIEHKVELSDSDIGLDIIKTELATGHVNFNADIIVSGGKGLQNRDEWESVVGGLCTVLKNKFNITVEKGASRAAVEQGFTDRSRQVGQTGTSVAPKIYFAIGISGAIQHIIGLANTDTIIAVNNDPNAPIFKNCDYYVVGDAESIVTQLVKQLEAT